METIVSPWLKARSLGVTGGANNTRTQVVTLREGVDVLVGTPGRVSWLVKEGHVDTSDLAGGGLLGFIGVYRGSLGSIGVYWG